MHVTSTTDVLDEVEYYLLFQAFYYLLTSEASPLNTFPRRKIIINQILLEVQKRLSD